MGLEKFSVSFKGAWGGRADSALAVQRIWGGTDDREAKDRSHGPADQCW